MGSFDCYCALCSGPLGKGFVTLGSKNVDALRKRRKKLRAEKKKLEREKAGDDTPIEEVDDDVDMDDGEDYNMQLEALAKSNWQKSAGKNNNDDGDDEAEDDDDDDYEPPSASTSSISSEDSIIDSNDGSDLDLIMGNDDSWSQCSDLSIYSNHDFYHGTAESDEYFSSSETCSYDPSVLNPSIIQWIDRCRALAYNEDAPGVTKAYITGRGRYDDYGGFNIKRPGHDPNDAGFTDLSCYYTFGGTELPVFPFHEACFSVLTRNLGHTDPNMVDKDVLYRVMSQHVEGYSKCLMVDYGLIPRGWGEQFWECLSGEEFVVCDPGFSREIEESLQSMLPAELFSNSKELVNLSSKVRNDPWTVVPYDILLMVISSYLSTEDTTSLLTASWHVFTSTRDSAFWKHMLRTRLSTVIWELPHFLTTANFPDTFDFKRLFLCLDSVTAPKFGARGPFMGVANRRRIWGICEKVAPSYMQQVIPDKWPEPDEDQANELLDSAVCLHMPIVLHPQPKATQTISVQFIRAWTEVSDRSCAMSTYWNNDGKLIGISTNFGTVERVFGSTDGQDKGQSMYIPADDWISTIIVYFNDHDRFREHSYDGQGETDVQATNEVAITALQVTLISGKSKYFEGAYRQTPTHRPFVVLPNMTLIGLTGEVSENGVISRLGLLQAPRPGTGLQRNNTLPTYPLAQTLLYTRSGMHLHTVDWRCDGKIWSHPTHTLHGWPKADHGNQMRSDMLLHEVFLWADAPGGYTNLTGLSALQAISGYRDPSRAEFTTNPVLEIRGLKKKDPHKTSSHIMNPSILYVPEKYPGWDDRTEPPSRELKLVSEPGENTTTSHFDIDGPGGEVVNEVHFSSAFGTLKLCTNRGRECVWGDAEKDCDLVKREEPGELIIGMSCCFRSLGGPGWGRLIDVGVITTRDDESDDEMMVDSA